jgi:endonuclease/exonuclease/phosphatase family metal-dependent hydrolase
MKSRIRYAILLLLLVTPLAVLGVRSPVSAAEPTTLRILSYNIHYGQGVDGKYDLARLAEVINKAQPDLVALQEVDVGVKRSGRVHQAQRLGELTKMSVRFGPTQHYQGGLYGNAVLTRLPILDVVIQPLPYTDSTSQRVTYPRGAISVTVRGPDEKPLRFISTHFQHNVPEDRLAEAKAINKLFVNPDNMPTILAGDMNAVPDSEPIRELVKHWTNAIDDNSSPTAPSGEPTSRIDYIFYRPQAMFRLTHTEVISEALASDHRPVLAVFEVMW